MPQQSRSRRVVLSLRSASLLLVIYLIASGAKAITIGAGPAVGTDKKLVTWFQEFQDWSAANVRALDVNADDHHLDGNDSSRDIVAFYSALDATNLYLRVDFFNLGFGVENGGLDVYVTIDCAAGGRTNFPDSLDTGADPAHPWEICTKLYSSAFPFLETSAGANFNAGYPSYWRADLDGVEWSIARTNLTASGWDGTSTLYFQVGTAKDSTEDPSGSDLTDAIGTLTTNLGSGQGLLTGVIPSTSTAGRAKYAVIAHANQSVATRSGTQTHIFRDYDANLKPGFVRLLDSAEMFHTPINLHISGTLLMSFLWATQDPSETGLQGFPNRDGPTFLNRVKQFVNPTNGTGSLVGGVLAEHIMPYYEGDVNQKSIQQNSAMIQELFGLSESNMAVMHVPERVIRSDTNNAHVSSAGPLDGKTFEDIAASGFTATYLDEVTHLHWWFYPNETNNPGWDTNNCGRWAGGRGNDEEKYHHKIHKINGVYCFMINDREDQSKFGPDDDGLQLDTRYTLLKKAMDPDSAQLTLVFDDWEAYAGNSFASSTPNGNADQFHKTLRWAANHPWIEIVNLKNVLGWALSDTNWVIDHGTNNFDKASQTYEYLKRSSEKDYDNWYYGSASETSLYDRVPPVHDNFVPGGMKKYGDMNATNTLMRDSWDRVQQIASTNLRKLAEWSYSAMVYETAWHDEDANPDQYKSRNYQVDFNRTTAQGNCDDSYADSTTDGTAGWALRLHGHARDMGVLKAASDWVQNIKNATQGATPTLYAADIDDDTLNEYVLCNNKVFLCFEGWGARLIKAFEYDPAVNGGDAVEVIGVPVSNPAEESENEGQDNNRCSAFKDRDCSGLNDSRYVDMDCFLVVPPVQGSNYWIFTSQDTNVIKKVSLQAGRDVVTCAYTMKQPAVGTMYTRYGLGPNQFDLMLHGHSNLVKLSDASFRGLTNTQGGAAFVVAGRNCAFVNGAINSAGWDNREFPLVEQFETSSSSTNWTVSLAFSETSARDVDGDGLSNTNELVLGTDSELSDTDGDSMPDGYEVANGLAATNASDVSGDLDGDGMLNWQEYVANSQANSSSSFLRVTNVSRPNAVVEIIHPVSAPRHYQILFADGSVGSSSWLPFANTNPPVGSFLNTNPAVGSHVFTDDFSVATTGSQTTNGQRSYTIRVSLP